MILCQTLDAASLAANRRWWEIYEQCFPFAAERELPDAIINSVRSGAGTAWQAQDEGETVGILRTYALSDAVDFMAYLGVAPAFRRRGVADAMFRALPAKDILFEVEDPAHAAFYGATPAACETRIAWYQTHFGAAVLDLAYLQPPLIPGTAAFPLRLMWTGRELATDEALAMVWRLYERFYHQANGVPLAIVKDCYARVSG